MAIDKDELLRAIDFGRENAYGSFESSGLAEKRAKAIEYYLGLNTRPAPEGRSQVVDRSVYETIQTLLPSLVRIFAGSSEEVCKAMPIGPNDEAGAEQTTAVLKHYVTEKNQWEQICSDWIHDALLLSNSYCIAYWDESKRTVRETYEGQSDDQLAALMQDSNVKVLQHSQKVDKQATAENQEAYRAQLAQYAQVQQMAAAQEQQAGMPSQLPPPPQKPAPILRHDLVIERAENEGQVCIKVLPPEHCIVSADTPDWTLQDCPYFEFRQQKTISDLRAMGLDVPEDISDDESKQSPEDLSRDRFGEIRSMGEDNKGVMRLVWARMCWVRADAESDEESRLYYVIAVGRTILFAEPAARIPISSMTPQPLPHRHMGMSVAETVVDLQDIKQAIKRGALDNLYLANNARNAISNKVNLEDFLDARPGGVVRMVDDSLPSEGHIFPLVHPFAFDNIVGSLEYFDQERQNRTGAMRGAAGLEANAMNRAAVGTTVAMQNAGALRTEHIARMMAPAVENLFSCVWEIISKHANKPLSIKLKGKWTLVDPQAWRTKRDIRISVGVGAGNKDSMQTQLVNILQAQMAVRPLGLAGPDEIHQTLLEQVKLAGFANPEKFYIDPTGKPPPPPVPMPEQIQAQTALQLKQMELTADAQKFQADQMAKMTALQKQHEDRMAELQANLQLQASNDARDSQREQARAQMDAQIKAIQEENKKFIAEMQAGVDKYKADLQSQTQLALGQLSAPPPVDLTPIQTGLQDLMGYIQAPAEILRDETGRAYAVKKGNVTRKVQRGPDGRAIGVQ